MKENIILPENLLKLDAEKMDVWSFGFILHKVITRELPAFDPTRKPILNQRVFSPGMADLITRCLSLSPQLRPNWKDINLEELEKGVVVEEVSEVLAEREVIKLGTSKEVPSEKMSRQDSKYKPIMEEEEVINVS